MAEEKNEKPIRSKRRFPLAGLLMVLFLAFSLSSGMVGFLLGRNAARPTGALVDTIILSPTQTPASRIKESAVTTVHFLSGRIVDSAGKACSDLTVRLEQGKSDVTDSQGKFCFEKVTSGKHRLEAVDDSGDVLGSMELNLAFSGETDVSAGPAESPTDFTLPEEARMLELTLTLGEDRSLEVEEGAACFVTRDGQVVNFDGGALPVEESSHAVTPAGSLTDTAGYVLMPSRQEAVTPRGELIPLETEEETVPGTVCGEDGSVRLEEGATVLSDGTVKLPDGDTVGGPGKVVLITNDGAEEIEQMPQEYVPYVPAKVPVGESPTVSTMEEASNGESSAGSGEEAPASSDAGSSAVSKEESSSQLSENPSESSGLPAAEDAEKEKRGLSIIDQDDRTWASGEGLEWSQMSSIDLFKNRSVDLGEEDGVPIAAPGSKGYYQFKLENPENYDIAYTISFVEQSFHLPMRYSVVDTSDNRSYLYQERTGGTGEPLESPEILIPAGGVQEFRIDWEWMYEDWFMPERDDVTDTTAASTGDGLYMVAVTLHARELPGTETFDPDGQIKYPGKR